ncbi:MAG: FG-GAP-like repeat-containing protein [Candidatus Delongbacteria bacterium]|jgi:hypothetical protein|nr:FG-GAP-like repeat-containing protein [Candidatus Delongbacteria bacterium]
MKKISILIIFVTAFFLFADEYIVPKKPASVDVADIDQDGDLDIILGHDKINDWTGISILTNDGYGIFSYSDSIYYPINHGSLHLLDLDSNNSYDILTEYYDDKDSTCVGVLYNFNDSLYENHYSIKKGASYFNIGDIDSDHDNDVLFYSNPNFYWGYIENNGRGVFADPVYFDLDYPPNGIACGDLNGDGRDDIILNGLDIWFNYNTGLQHYKIPESYHVGRVNIADVDSDNDNDIIATEWGMPGTYKTLLIYSNDSEGNFQLTYTKQINEAMAYIFISDLNNDNYPDIIYNVSIYYNNSEEELFNTYVLYNNQDGTFQDPVNYYTGICSHKSFVADLDGNGWSDIITLNYDFYDPPPEIGTIHILFNDTTSNFVEESQTSIDNSEVRIENFELEQNYPNPFNNQTSIDYGLNKISEVEINIFNTKGEFVKSLVNEKQGKGKYTALFNANKLNSGVYYYRLKIDGFVKETKRMLYLR